MPRTKPKTKEPDLRLVRGSPIHAKATAVLGGLAKATKIYGSVAKDRDVNGTVADVVLRETRNGRTMKRIIGRYRVGVRTVVKELAINVIVAGESKKYPISAERTDTLGSQKTIATFVTPPAHKKPPPSAVAPIAPTAIAPPTQMTPTTDSSDDDIPLIALKKKKADKKPPPPEPTTTTPPAATQDAIILATDDEGDDDDVKLAAVEDPSPPTEGPPTDAAAPPPATPVQPLRPPLEVTINETTWTESVPIDLLNGGHHHHDWHHKTSMRGVHVCEGSDAGGLLPLRYYFDAVFPQPHFRNIIRWTNDELANAYLKPTNEAEVLKFFGIILLIPRLPQVPRKRLWSTDPLTKYSVLPNLGRTGMTRDRFKHLLQHMRFSFQPKEKMAHVSDEGHAWMLIDGFVDAINEWKSKRVYPGSIVCVDESMIRWYGLGGEYIKIGAPFYVVIDGKPDAGIEIQTSACAKSGLMLQLKVMRSQTETAKRNFVRHVPTEENAGTTAVKELTQPWHRSNRVAVGDSAFASVATAMEMKKVGMGFVGCVKNAHKGFPKEYLSKVQLGGRGDYFGMMAMKENVELLAFTWCDRDRRSFIASAGSLAKANQQERFRYCRSGQERCRKSPGWSRCTPCRRDVLLWQWSHRLPQPGTIGGSPDRQEAWNQSLGHPN